MKLCVDCRWCQKIEGFLDYENWAECGHPSAAISRPPSPVTGEVSGISRELCRFHRHAAGFSKDPCGPDGKYWEAAEPVGFT